MQTTTTLDSRISALPVRALKQRLKDAGVVEEKSELAGMTKTELIEMVQRSLANEFGAAKLDQISGGNSHKGNSDQTSEKSVSEMDESRQINTTLDSRLLALSVHELKQRLKDYGVVVEKSELKGMTKTELIEMVQRSLANEFGAAKLDQISSRGNSAQKSEKSVSGMDESRQDGVLACSECGGLTTEGRLGSGSFENQGTCYVSWEGSSEYSASASAGSDKRDCQESVRSSICTYSDVAPSAAQDVAAKGPNGSTLSRRAPDTSIAKRMVEGW